MSTFVEIGLTNAVLATGLGLVVLCITRVWKNPHLAHALWLIVLLKLVTPPVVDIPLPFHALSVIDAGASAPPAQVADTVALTRGSVDRPADVPPEPSASHRADPRESLTTSVQTPVSEHLISNTEVKANSARPWTWWVAMAWLAGSLLWAAMAVGRIVRFHRTLGTAQNAPQRLRALAEEMATTVKLTACPRLRVVDNRLAPMVWPLGRTPTVILSQKLLAALDEDELKPVLAHEFAHLVRRDHWVRWFEILVGVVFWWHPVLWLARKKLQTAEEMCCDALVMERCSERNSRVYADALLKVAEFCSGFLDRRPTLATGLGTQRQLTRRIEMLIHGELPERLRTGAKVGMAIVTVFVLPLSASEFQPRSERTEAQVAETSSHAVEAGEGDKVVQRDAPRLPTSKTPADLPIGETSPEALDVLRSHVKFLEGQFARIEALNKIEAIGGEAVKLHLMGYELFTVKGELSLAEGRSEQAVVHFEAAFSHATTGREAAQAAHKIGTIDETWLIETTRNLFKAEMRLIAMKQSVGRANASQTRDKAALRFAGKSFHQWRDVLINDLDNKTRLEAIRAIAELGVHGYAEEAVAVLSPLINEDDPDALTTSNSLVYDVFESLGRLGPAAVPELIKAMGGENKVVAMYAAYALHRIGPEAEKAVPALLTAATDEYEGLRSTALRALGEIGESSQQITAVLAKGLTDEEKGVRFAAAFSLAKVGAGADAKPAVPILVEYLRTTFVRYQQTKNDPMMDRLLLFESIDLLGKIGPGAKEAIPLLEEMVKKPPTSDSPWSINQEILKRASAALEKITGRADQ